MAADEIQILIIAMYDAAILEIALASQVWEAAEYHPKKGLLRKTAAVPFMANIG